MDATLTAAAIGVGGTVIVGLVGFWANVRNTNKTTALALRTLELTEQGQVTDRYSKAIEQLGSDKLDVRIGGIYALERIARDSARDHPTIMEVLAAFIRDHSPEQWPPAKRGTKPPARTTRPDVQAAATVIGRRTIRHDSQPINLAAACLNAANLSRAILSGADLTFVDLTVANLIGADLSGADFGGANLFRANLGDANLRGADLSTASLGRVEFNGADLTNADLTYADLTGAHLNHANLTGAHLTGARFISARLMSADLRSADLAFAEFTGALLTDALWPSGAAVPEGWHRDPDSGRLNRADADSGNPPADPAPAT
jgi:hypothetical protein